MQDLTLTLIQADMLWQSPQQNRQMYAELMDQNAQHTDLVVLPEMFSTGFTMDSRTAAEPMGGPTCQWLQQQAQQRGYDDHDIGVDLHANTYAPKPKTAPDYISGKAPVTTRS